MKRKLHFAFYILCLISALLTITNQSVTAQTYCTPPDACADDWIQSFSTTGGTTNITNNGTGCTGSGYTYYSTMIHSATAGSIVNYSFTNNSGWSEWYKIWVDWNSNGSFTDAGEQMYASAAAIGTSVTVTGNFTIPAAATAGNKRMRIRCGYAESALDPCLGSLILCGETEDYQLNVAPNSCSGAPNGGTTAAASTLITCNTTTTLSLTGNTSGNGITYQWQYNTTGTWVNFGTNTATQTTPPVVQGTQFRCRVTCTNAGGSSTTSTPVTVSVTPQTVALGNDTTICPGISYTFNAGNPGAAYSWSTGATTQSITTNAAGTYSVSVTYPNGCTGSDAITVAPGVVPVNNLPTITNLCAGETATLNAGNTGSTYKWTPGNATTQTINASMPGNYNVTVKSTTGCIISNTTNLIIRPLPVAALGNDTSICDGAQITLNAGNPGNAYNWNTGANTQTINITDSGTYSVVVTTPYDCILEEDKHIAFLPSPRVEGFNFVPLFYEELGKVKFSPLNPQNVNSYLWDFGDGTNTSTQANPEHSYTSGGNYIVTLSVFNGCGNYEISLTINVDITTGIVKLDNSKAEVMLYPNPSKDYIIIENKSDDLKMQQVSIFNTLGASVYTHQADNSKNHKLNVQGLASGIYSIRILTDKGYVIRKMEVIK
jgi:PKD repeat protein